ncbi:methyltransferase [Trabulsiella odontotermitis]|uniref:O-linked N-acetylglucosamine transferase family protein n=1 Tax=Trabulsiella odontotermitis TaxID=379893 RepID=UPI003ACDB6FC
MPPVNMQYLNRHTTPVALHASALLYGITLASPVTARILELGCGNADGLIAHARAWPQSICVGVDIDENLIEQARGQITTLALSNIEPFAAGLGDLLTVDPGQFDYIIIHGVFACSGAAERDALLAWCREHLSADGIICLQHSVLPGASSAQQLRDALAFHLRRGDENADPLTSARGMLGWMAMTLPDGELKNRVLEAEALDDTALTFAYLIDSAPAVWYSDFHQHMAEIGLCPVGDAIPQSELPEVYNGALQQLHGLIAGNTPRPLAQQYLDLAVNRAERVTLLSAHIDQAPQAKPDLQHLEQLHWAGNFTRMLTDDGTVANGHRSASGQPLSTSNEVTLHILDLLGGAWPMSLSFEQLVFNTRLPENPGDTRDAVRESLRDLYLIRPDGLHWSAFAGPYNDAQSASLQPLCPLTDNATTATNLWGVTVEVTAQERQYLQSGFTATDDGAWDSFMSLRVKGMLTGSTDAWKTAIQRFLRQGDPEKLKPLITTLLLLSVSVKRGGLLADERYQEPKAAHDEQAIDAIYDEVNRLIGLGKAKEARDYTQNLLADSPDDLHILRCYSRACILTSAWQDALSALCKLMGYYFSSLDIYFDLATALQKLEQRFYARKIIQGLLRLDGKSAGFWHSLATLYHAQGDNPMAEKCSREAFRYQPESSRYLAMLGVILSDNQKLDEARYFLEKSLELSPDYFDSFTSLLFVVTHDSSLSPAEQLEKHKEYGRRVEAWAKGCDFTAARHVDTDPQRKLRIGFVSGDLRQHPVSNFLLPFWDSFNRQHFELVGYSASPVKDRITEHLQSGAVLWRDAELMSDIELAKQITADEIDILIDLSGHTTFTRLPVFALHPAPVQMTWIGYPGTSGLSAMDYRILSTGCMNPPGLEKQFLEKIIYTPMRKLFEPDKNSPEINLLPALTNGYITFGSFNRPKKINEEVLRLWAEILIKYPQSRLLIGFMNDATVIQSLTRQLAALGIGEERLIFQGRMPLQEYLACHHRVDILLDTFPYTGGTTTNHAAWMGVPTLTLCGDTLACRQGVENMNSYGLSQFIAMDKDDYVNKALYWRDHFDELNAIRLGMRNQIPVETKDGFNAAEHLEYALRHAWTLYCQGQSPRSFVIDEAGNATHLSTDGGGTV